MGSHRTPAWVSSFTIGPPCTDTRAGNANLNRHLSSTVNTALLLSSFLEEQQISSARPGSSFCASGLDGHRLYARTRGGTPLRRDKSGWVDIDIDTVLASEFF